MLSFLVQRYNDFQKYPIIFLLFISVLMSKRLHDLHDYDCRITQSVIVNWRCFIA